MPKETHVKDQEEERYEPHRQQRHQEAPRAVQFRGVRAELDQVEQRGRGRCCDGADQEHGFGHFDPSPQGGGQAEEDAAAYCAPDRCEGAEQARSGSPGVVVQAAASSRERESKPRLATPRLVAESFDRILVDGLALQAYTVGPGPGGFSYACIVYAGSEGPACAVAARELDLPEGDLTATRAPEHDERAWAHFLSCVEQDDEYLREAGWRREGEWTCVSCGLAANGMERFAVCRVSGQCKECGCLDDEDDDGRIHPCAHEEGFNCE